MTKEALKLALEALENLFGIPDKWTGEGGGDVAVWRLGGSYRAQQAITAIKEALAQPEQEPVLQDIEQYRLQMAGISTAAIGYWKESDSIHPDYDTVALRDVAKLYAKYDELYKAQDVSHGMIAGALFDFMGWLTSRPKRIMLSSADDASPAVDAIKDFARLRSLSLDDAQVQNWQEALAEQPPQRKPLTENEFNPDWDTQAVLVEEMQRMAKRIEELKAQRNPLTDEELQQVMDAEEVNGKIAVDFARAIEAAHNIKENT